MLNTLSCFDKTSSKFPLNHQHFQFIIIIINIFNLSSSMNLLISIVNKIHLISIITANRKMVYLVCQRKREKERREEERKKLVNIYFKNNYNLWGNKRIDFKFKSKQIMIEFLLIESLWSQLLMKIFYFPSFL